MESEMGILFEFVKAIESNESFSSDFEIVTEADDITGDVEKEASGAGDDDSDGDSIDNSGGISTNTDDLLGSSESDDDNNDNEDSDDDDPTDDDSMDDDNDSEEDPTEDGESSDENGDDNSLGDDPTQNPEEDKDDSFSELRKNKLKKQFLYLFNVIDNSINLVSTYVPNVTNDATIQTLSSVKENLEQCKETIFYISTHEFNKMEYHELLKKYVGINRIYELCTKILETYFKKYGDSQNQASK